MRAPIFIIGFPRSGTSFVGKLISQFTGYPSHGESHTLTLLQEVQHQINLYRRRTDFTGKELVKQLDLQALKDINTTFFREFYLRTYGSEQFIDKTPGAVACHGWGVVKEVFPNAAFVACVRSPVEVYESAAVKFGSKSEQTGNQSPLQLALGWSGAMEGINKLSNSEYSKDLHCISQLELRSKPEIVVKKLFDFLGISADKTNAAVHLCRKSREDVLTQTIKLNQYKKLADVGLNFDDEVEFRAICLNACRRWDIEL
jgi:hypothetical protein